MKVKVLKIINFFLPFCRYRNKIGKFLHRFFRNPYQNSGQNFIQVDGERWYLRRWWDESYSKRMLSSRQHYKLSCSLRDGEHAFDHRRPASTSAHDGFFLHQMQHQPSTWGQRFRTNASSTLDANR